jgi:hypothetical protein
VLDLVAYRWTDYDTPLWVNPSRSPGRWHRPGAQPTQYWSLHPLGPWAEYARAFGIVNPADLVGIASRTWAALFTLDPDAVAEITFDTAAEWSITADELVGDDHTACQNLGDRVRTTHQALIAPSAALPGTQNLIAFGPRAISPYAVAPPDPEQDVPAAVTADRGRPPTAILDFVCHRGVAHSGLALWKVGQPIAVPGPSY